MNVSQLSVYPYGDVVIAPAATVNLVTVPVANSINGIGLYSRIVAGPGTSLDFIVSKSANGTDFTVMAAKRFLVGFDMNGERERTYSSIVSAVTTGYITIDDLDVNNLNLFFTDLSIVGNTTSHIRLSAHNGGVGAITVAACGIGDGIRYS